MPRNKDAFIAPQSARQYQTFLETVDRLDGDVETARKICRWLNVPGHLLHFGWVNKKIARLLTHSNTYLQAIKGDKRIQLSAIQAVMNTLEDWIAFFIQHQREFEHVMGYPFSKGPDHTAHPLKKKGMKRYGLYAALLCIPQRQGSQKLWEKLCLRFLIVHATQMQTLSQEVYESHTGSDEISSSKRKLYAPAKNLRYLTESDHSQILENVDDDIWLSHTLIDRDASDDGATPLRRLLKSMSAIERGLSGKLTSNIPRQRERESSLYGLGHVDIDKRVRMIESGDHDEEDLFDQSFIDVDQIDDDWLAEKSSQNDIAPGEIGEGHLLSLAHEPGGVTQHSMMMARNRQRHQVLQAQMFPWQRSQLSFHQLGFVHRRLHSIIRHFEEMPDRKDSETLQYETALILLTALWTGSSLSRAVGVTHHHSRVENSDRMLGYYEHRGEEAAVRYEWRFRALFPDYLTHPNFNPELLREKVKSFWLPDLFGVVPHLLRFREQLDHKRSQYLFHRDVEVYEQCARTIIKHWQTDLAGEGITLHKIEHFLLNHIAAETNDITTAAYITGEQHRQCNTTMFYTTPTLIVLRNTYLQSMQPLLSMLNKTHKKIVLADDTKAVGARHCLTVEACQTAIQNVMAQLPSQSHEDWEEQVQYFNHLTFCHFLLFSYSTAARAIENPILFPSAFNRSGFAAYTDKDTIPPYHARLIWLPPWVIETLRQYENIRKQIALWVKIRAPDKTNAELSHPAFFITGQKQNHVVSVTPKHLRTFFAKYMDVPANAHRRFLRTVLLERGMDIEHINAFLGHWSCGEEPWHLHSSFSVDAYVAALKEHLEPLLIELGFKALLQHFQADQLVPGNAA